MSTPHHPLEIMLTSNDMPKSIAFYRDVLGFELEASWPDETNPMWANMVLDGQSVMVGANMEPQKEHCHGDAAMFGWWKARHATFNKSEPGAGVLCYLRVDDVDAYHASIKDRGAEPFLAPTTQFYGIRDFPVADPDGYQLMFYTPVKVESCGSCGMPLTAAEPGQMFCQHCTDDSGKLRPYEQVLEGTIQGYFMAMQKMARAEAEPAAKAHLAKMPAWSARKGD